MKYTHLGRTGLQVSRFCLGTGGFGSDISVFDSHVLMDHALDLGINFLDTANVYGGEQGVTRIYKISDNQGRTAGNKLVFFADTGDWAGKLARVQIAQTGPWTLQGKLVGEGVPA